MSDPRMLIPVDEVIAAQHAAQISVPAPSDHRHEQCPVWQEAQDLHAELWHLLSLVLEVFNHQRPARQLRAALTSELLAALRIRSHRMSGLHRLRSLHTCRPAEDVIELCATSWVTFRTRLPRAMAIAARLERRSRRWVCTDLCLLGSAEEAAPGVRRSDEGARSRSVGRAHATPAAQAVKPR
ncbi:Rv3235 family protein [Nocardia sp. NBC_01327]|uniref:Rv3235 family protein n=1 Tax=Nocardia sp. NBC_01327 TaxID=2903593 RepID=UPI003FA39E39